MRITRSQLVITVTPLAVMEMGRPSGSAFRPPEERSAPLFHASISWTSEGNLMVTGIMYPWCILGVRPI